MVTSAALALAVAAPLAWANMAAPPPPKTVHAGSELGEPASGLRDVAIEHEMLRLDLRPLADGKPVWVDATYRVRNDGAARTLDLLFVANGLARGRSIVTVDGRAVPSTPGTAAALPAEWRAPPATPALAPAHDSLPYAPTGEGRLTFRVTLPPGRHEIRVRYPAEATVYSTNELTPVWQLGYVLAPAREWGSFGGAEVRVELPRGWAARTEPALRRDGDALVGSWRSIPADALAISAQQPEPGTGKWYLLWLAITAAALAGCGCIAWTLGAMLGRRGRTSAWVLPASVLLTVGWIALSLVLYGTVPSFVARAAGRYASDYAIRAMSYGSSFFMVMLVPLMLLLGSLTMQLCAFFGGRRARRTLS